MTWLYEESLYALLIGVPLTIGLLFAWLQTAKRPLLYAGGLALLLTIAAVVVEATVETDRETITSQLEQIAADVQNADVETVIQHVHPDAPETTAQAKANLEQYDVRRARITKIHEIEVDRGRSPAESHVKLNAIVEVDQYRGPLAFTVTLRLDGERWKVLHYEYHEPLAHVRK